MSVKYYFSKLSTYSVDGTEEYRLFAVLQNSWYWAIEWSSAGKDEPSHLTDFNAGVMSAMVKESLSALKLIPSTELQSRFGTFARYIENAVDEYGNYIAAISRSAEKPDVVWQISRS